MPPPAIDYGATYTHTQWLVLAEEYKSVKSQRDPSAEIKEPQAHSVCPILLFRSECWDELNDGSKANPGQNAKKPCPRPCE
jgi:hypothetical protein